MVAAGTAFAVDTLAAGRAAVGTVAAGRAAAGTAAAAVVVGTADVGTVAAFAAVVAAADTVGMLHRERPSATPAPPSVASEPLVAQSEEPAPPTRWV